jgi:ADP-ribose pyrophosphatase YjhB (NUDIX family)
METPKHFNLSHHRLARDASSYDETTVEPDDNPAFDGMWQIPGAVSMGKILPESAVREAKEEIGVDVVVERTLAVTQAR